MNSLRSPQWVRFLFGEIPMAEHRVVHLTRQGLSGEEKTPGRSALSLTILYSEYYDKATWGGGRGDNSWPDPTFDTKPTIKKTLPNHQKRIN